METFSPLPWRTTVAMTLPPLSRGVPSFTSAPWPTQQHFAEFDGGAGFGIELFDAQRGVFRDPVLFTAGGDDRVHEEFPERARRHDERPRILLTDPQPGQTAFSECGTGTYAAGSRWAMLRHRFRSSRVG